MIRKTKKGWDKYKARLIDLLQRSNQTGKFKEHDNVVEYFEGTHSMVFAPSGVYYSNGMGLFYRGSYQMRADPEWMWHKITQFSYGVKTSFRKKPTSRSYYI